MGPTQLPTIQLTWLAMRLGGSEPTKEGLNGDALVMKFQRSWAQSNKILVNLSNSEKVFLSQNSAY